MINIIKLKNGVEIIGSELSTDDKRIVLENPFTINYLISADSDRPIIGLLRYMQFADDFRTSFSRDDILSIAVARKSMVNYYEDILKTYELEIDESIDKELQRVVSDDVTGETESDNNIDVLSAMIDKIKQNLH